ncbi:prepilin peptidase dependent protein C [Gibbsiella quercinecans]|uniref:Potassium:proton antiporter n=1 Tax=Gibbsiella quercinecans TaxID=929813 RepID=A0A250B4H2_9GAMM|nr:potassium:proton antiporter [Gibbsiella quercinecans]RLM10460.1 potassium:proton antiporter [Gibbsiella quercinecans]TCT85876.1 prepilin peptidase dependent protein C [Gibbsiella quercinecans]
MRLTVMADRRACPANGRASTQRGFSLLEVLVAALLFAVSLLGLLQYQQVLLQGFQRQWQYRQAWALAHRQLESVAASGQTENAAPLPAGWQADMQRVIVDPPCQRVVVRIRTPLRQEAALSRWFCSPG